MFKWLKRMGIGLLICGVGLAGCGGDDEETPTGLEQQEPAEVSEEGVLLAGTLVQSMQAAFFASLVEDPTTVEGMAGVLEITGNIWDFKDYSPDGELIINGQLTVEKDLFPNIPARGELTLSGSQEGTLIVDILVGVQGVEFTATGTLQLNDQVWDMAELIASASAGEEGE